MPRNNPTFIDAAQGRLAQHALLRDGQGPGLRDSVSQLDDNGGSRRRAFQDSKNIVFRYPHRPIKQDVEAMEALKGQQGPAYI
jgi:hypothetical protein